MALLAGLAALLLFALVSLVGCGAEDPPDVSGSPATPVEPAPPDFATPESAVTTYLDWITYAYRIADSDVATAVMTPWEHVRVDSYIELNRQQGRAIDQELLLFEVRSSESEDGTATVAVREEWTYRYFSLETGDYISEPLTASYDTTYTVVREDERWLVDSVDAEPLAPVE
jgi:hypothetical protein